MKPDRNAFKLGITVIVAFVLFFAGVVFIGGKSLEPREPVVVRIGHDENVPRIKPGAAIVCGPQQVGTIQRVRMVEATAVDDPKRNDFLYFEIQGEVNRSLGLRADCTIAVEGPLLGDNGQLRILDRGRSTTRATAAGPIYAQPSGFFSDWAMITRELDADDPNSLLSQIKTQLDPHLPQSLIAKVHLSLADINTMTSNLKRSVDPTQKTALINKVDAILTHINLITMALKNETESDRRGSLVAKIHQGLDHVDQALTELIGTISENREGIGDTVQSTRHVVQQLDQSILPAIRAELDTARTESLLSQVRAALTKANAALDDVDSVTGKARRLAAVGEPQVLAVLANAKEASQHLKAVSKDLRRHPWRLIHKPGETESKQAYLFDAVREFTEASAHLDDSAARLDALLGANGGRIPVEDPLLRDIREELRSTLERFVAAEKALWDQLDVP